MEKWKDIDGHPNHQVSDQGRVMNKKTGRIMKQFKARNGYMQTYPGKIRECCYDMSKSYCGYHFKFV